jgi:hypothetical protein
MNLFRWLLQGSDDLILAPSWLSSEQRLDAERWTRRQLDQGAVISDVAAMRRRAFWQRIEAERHPKPRAENVRQFRESQR